MSYIDMLPSELLDIIYEKSNILYCGHIWKNAIKYNYLYDTSTIHRKNRKKTIYKYDYYKKEWINYGII